MRNVFKLAIVGLLSTGCVYSVDSEVTLNDEPHADDDYFDVYEDHTRSSEVIINFETRYRLHATLLSPAYKTAFKQRLQRIFAVDEGDAIFAESSTKAAFLVTITGADKRTLDLGDNALWSVLMRSQGKSLKPELVRQINEKARLRAFFPAVNDWSSEFLIVFDAAAINPKARELLEKTAIELLLANADAKVSFNW